MPPRESTSGKQLQQHWPPGNLHHYIHEDAFADSLLAIARQMQRRYPRLDFIAAVGLVWDWLDRKAKDDPDFLLSRSTPIKTRSSFRAYLRQALWNAAANERRQRRRRNAKVALVPIDLVSDPGLSEPTDTNQLWIIDLIEMLPTPIDQIMLQIGVDGIDIKTVAAAMHLSQRHVRRLYVRGCDMLAAGLKDPTQ